MNDNSSPRAADDSSASNRAVPPVISSLAVNTVTFSNSFYSIVSVFAPRSHKQALGQSPSWRLGAMITDPILSVETVLRLFVS